MSTPLQPLPNPFLNAPAGHRAARSSPWAVRPAMVACLLCLALGIVAVAWRAKRRADDAHARARLEALARGAALEQQFGEAVSAAETLGALARQGGGAIPDFQKVATTLLAARPGLATLELQPGGVVSDIVPRAAYARVIGVNVLNHPVYRPGAYATLQRRALTVAGPVALYTGEPGIVARVPIFLRGRDGRDAFWGFVAASMPLSEAVRRAQVDELARHGYDYALLAPATGQEKAVVLAGHRTGSASGAVRQPVRAQDLIFGLEVQPRGGWGSKAKLVLECLGVLAAAGLVGLVVNLLESRRAMEAGLADANQRLVRETEQRQQAQLESRGAKDEASAAQTELGRMRSELQSSRELEVRLNASVRAAEAAAQATQAELDQARMSVQQAEQTIASLQSRLRAAARVPEKSEVAPQPQDEPAQPATAAAPVPVNAAPLVVEPSAEANPASLGPVQAPDEEASKLHGEPAAELPPAASSDVEPPVPPSSLEAPASDTTPAAEPAAEKKPARTPRRKKARPDNQMDLFAPAPAPVAEPASEAPSPSAVEAPPPPAPDAPKPAAAAPSPKPSRPSRPLPPRPPLDPGQLRKAVNLILPLFTGRDPGAQDCLKANRATFRSAFTPEAYLEFEQTVTSGDFDAALEHLKKAARRHGIPA